MNKVELEAKLTLARSRIAELEQERQHRSEKTDAEQKTEQRVLQLNRLYATLSQINQTIIRVKSREELYRNICNVASRFGDFKLVWVGVVDEANQTFRPLVSSGGDLAAIPFANTAISLSMLHNSLVGKALQGSGSVTSEDIEADPTVSHWRDLAARDGYYSQAAVPFRLGGRTIGVLNLYSEEKGFFNSEEEVRLLDEIGLDISFALDTIEEEAIRQKTEEALVNSEKRYELLFEKAGIPACMTKLPENTFADVNEAFVEIFGYSKSDVVGRTSLELGLVRPEEQRRMVEQVKAGGMARDTERRVFTKSGEERIVTISVNRVEMDGSEYAITTLHDVTERKRAENKLRQQADLLELAHDSITVLDMDGRITFWNRGAASRYGWSEAEARGQVIHDLLRTEFPQPLEEIKQKLLEGGFWEGELTHTRKDGTQVIVASRWQLRREDGKPAAILEINNDITERKRAETEMASKNQELARLNTQTEHRLENISALRTIDTAIASSFDMDFTLGILLEQTLKRIRAEAADILIFNPVSRTFRRATELGIHGISRDTGGLRLGEGYAWQVVRERKTVTVQDVEAITGETPETIDMVKAGFRAYKGVPLVAKGTMRGVLELYQSNPFDLDAEQRAFLDTLAGQAAIAVDSAQLFENLQDSNTELRMAYDETIEGWSQAMDLRDRETEGHSLRVTEQTLQLATQLGSTPEELVHIRRGALLHDMGKLGVPDEILRKPGPLTEEEWECMRRHPQFAYEMLSRIAYLHPALDIPYCHHEKWDGSGYPRGLRQDQIPLSARVFAVIDVWDALTSDRVYRQAWPKEKAAAYLREQAGKHFDPRVVSAFLRGMGQEGG